jgi:hypothetical protein
VEGAVTTFFSVDVETSATHPFDGDLLTVGASAVRDGVIVGEFYIRLQSYGDWDPSTRQWWAEQDEFVRAEAYEDESLHRHHPDAAAEQFVEWVREIEPGDRRERVFVANPSTFDHQWINNWLWESGRHETFDYRTVCLRSMAFGQNRDWSAKVRNHDSEYPHHALYDARAQALDLIDLMKGGS